MIRFLLLIAVFFLSKFALQAQESVLLTGRVRNDTIDKSYLHILNLTSQKGTITNEGGQFTIPVRVGDTLYVSAVQFQHKKIVITPAIFSKGHIEFSLENEVNDLPEVNIRDIDLIGRLGRDIDVIKIEKPFDPASAGLPVYTGPTLTIEERRLYTAQNSANGRASVDALINGLSGRTEMLKKHVEISNRAREIQRARAVFTDSIYTRQLHIPQEYIVDFVHYVYEGHKNRLDLARTENPLALIEMLQKIAPEYIEFKAIKE